jgi:hypothetical protein
MGSTPPEPGSRAHFPSMQNRHLFLGQMPAEPHWHRPGGRGTRPDSASDSGHDSASDSVPRARAPGCLQCQCGASEQSPCRQLAATRLGPGPDSDSESVREPAARTGSLSLTVRDVPSESAGESDWVCFDPNRRRRPAGAPAGHGAAAEPLAGASSSSSHGWRPSLPPRRPSGPSAIRVGDSYDLKIGFK